MAPTKDNDTTHLDQFSAEELEDILVQLCDAEGVKVSADDDKPLKNLGKNALDSSGLGGLGKKIFGGGKKKEEQPPESPDGTAPAEPEPADKTAPAPRPASDVIRGLDLGDKQGLIGVLQNVLASALSGELDGSSAGGNRRQLTLRALATSALFACFGKLLKGGGSKSRNAIQTSSTQAEETQADGATSSGGTSAPAAVPSIEDLKTPEALFKYISGHPAVKTMVISGVQTFLAKALQNAQAGKA